MAVQPRLQFQASQPSAPQSTASKLVLGVRRAFRPLRQGRPPSSQISGTGTLSTASNLTREASYSLDLQTHAESGSRDAAL
jgi:hypothetical protein